MDVIKGEEAKRVASGGGHFRATIHQKVVSRSTRCAEIEMGVYNIVLSTRAYAVKRLRGAARGGRDRNVYVCTNAIQQVFMDTCCMHTQATVHERSYPGPATIGHHSRFTSKQLVHLEQHKQPGHQTRLDHPGGRTWARITRRQSIISV